MLDAFLSVITVGNLVASVVAGGIYGLYFGRVGMFARGARFAAWHIGFIGSALCIVRLAVAFARMGNAAEMDAAHFEIGRVGGGWALWLLFVAFLFVGVVLGDRWRERRVLKGASSGGSHLDQAAN